MDSVEVRVDRATYQASIELLQSARVRFLLERSPEASRALLFAWEAHTAATRRLNRTTRKARD